MEKEKCKACGGTGKMNCPLEYGGPCPEECPSCGGKQEIVCPFCDGTGKGE